MEGLPKKLRKKLQKREESNALRVLPEDNARVDFASNDYLGFAKSKAIFFRTHEVLNENDICVNGASGSRLLSGNHVLYNDIENYLADFHNAEAALVFNSGYDANLGFFSSVPQRGDVIFYDEFIHASIRDGLALSNAKSYKFRHNSLEDLEEKIKKLRLDGNYSGLIEVYIVTESVFSMDGDTPDLLNLVTFCEKNNCNLIVDEAHAAGVFGESGCGLIQEFKIEAHIFARINTFGKALGCHGAVILGSRELKSYLVNFARSFIYTTGLPPHSLATIRASYAELIDTPEIKKLQGNISLFNTIIEEKNLNPLFIKSVSAIHCCVISGNEKVKKIAALIQEKGFDVKPILSPTVPVGKERLRFCIHSYNSQDEIENVLALLATFVSN